jgi:hypothetical protein
VASASANTAAATVCFAIAIHFLHVRERTKPLNGLVVIITNCIFVIITNCIVVIVVEIAAKPSRFQRGAASAASRKAGGERRPHMPELTCSRAGGCF